LPVWIWTEDCIQPGHRFVLLGASGSGGATVTNHSPRLGGREGHVLQEVGHSIFAHCFRRESSDPFGQAEAIFGQQELGGHPGFNADDMLLCPGTPGPVFPVLLNQDFLDCRDPEHYFLGFLTKYRVDGKVFRDLIVQTGSDDMERYYAWVKDNWYDGQEFTVASEVNANFAEVGVPRR